MNRSSYFGQYRYKNSLLHGLDPRLKILYVFVLSILIFITDSLSKILIFSLVIILVILLSKIGVKSLFVSLRSFYSIFIFILVMYLLFSRNDIWQGMLTIWRFLMLILMSIILMYTTTISDLVCSIERLSSPMKVFNIKPRNIAVMISITVRFVPMMFANFERLRDAMTARLADLRKLRMVKLIMLCLLEKMLKSASNLSDSMQSRLYNENAKSSKSFKLDIYDYASVIFILIFAVVIY